MTETGGLGEVGDSTEGVGSGGARQRDAACCDPDGTACPVAEESHGVDPTVAPVPSLGLRGEASSGGNIADGIFRDLRGRILRGELAPGSRLPGERELSVTYETNRNTLREAFRRLEQARLITVRHGQGVTVADFRRAGQMELLGPFLEAGPDLREAVHILEDILPARALVIEFAAKMAVRRADRTDIERLESIGALLIAAHARGDARVVGRCFHSWLDALVDAAHSVAIRWTANPFLDAYREILGKFPELWVLESTFPAHLEEVAASLRDGDEGRALRAVRTYYGRVDPAFMTSVRAVMAQGPDETGARADALSTLDALSGEGVDHDLAD